MQINIDPSAGFCWGVVRAINFAEEELKKNGRLYSLGDIIHNDAEVKRLSRLGIETISVKDFRRIGKGSRVLIRAHGEPPETYVEAEKYGIVLVDATCPVVSKVQERIKKFYDQDFQIIIFGKKDHAEVTGLNGVINNEAIIVLTVEEALAKTDFSRSTVLFSQTTMDKQTFRAITEALKSRINGIVVDSMEENASEFYAKDTICGQVSGRERKIREFARANDVILFAAGKKSSNGKVLLNIVREENSRTYFIEDTEDIDQAWFDGAYSIGITGATSTPQWLMEKIKKEMDSRFSGSE